MKVFTRQDGLALQVVEGFRDRVLSYRTAVTPREGWEPADYRNAAARKFKRGRRLLDSFARHGHELSGSTLLDVGCGDGSNCLIAAHAPVRRVTGIDLFLPLHSVELKGQQTRRLARELIREIRGGATPAAEAKDEQSPETLLGKLPVEFHVMDATAMKFQDGEFDLVLSRSAMEHIQPIEAVLREIVRVVRRGGMIYLGIDPFFWVRGCHKRAVVDIPWAHARMDIEDFTRFVEQHESSEIAAKRRRRIETLNRFTVETWRRLVEGMQCKLLDWQERPSLLGEQVLQDYSGVTETLLPGISQRDLLCERIEVWLRRE